MSTTTLGWLARERRNLDIWCVCRKGARIVWGPEQYLRLGERLNLDQAADRLKCSQCGRTGRSPNPRVTCRPGWPIGYDPSKHGNVHNYRPPGADAKGQAG